MFPLEPRCKRLCKFRALSQQEGARMRMVPRWSSSDRPSQGKAERLETIQSVTTHPLSEQRIRLLEHAEDEEPFRSEREYRSTQEGEGGGHPEFRGGTCHSKSEWEGQGGPKGEELLVSEKEYRS